MACIHVVSKLAWTSVFLVTLALACSLAAPGNTGAQDCAEPQDWRPQRSVYTTQMDGKPAEVLLLEGPRGGRATVLRWPVVLGDVSEPGGEEAEGWRTWRLEGAAWARYKLTDKALDAVVQAGEYLYTLRADRDAGIDLEDLAGLWIAAYEAFVRWQSSPEAQLPMETPESPQAPRDQQPQLPRHDQDQQQQKMAQGLAEVRARLPEELVTELWVVEIEDLVQSSEPKWWIKPGGLVERAVVCEDVVRGEPSGVRKRFPAGTRSVYFWARLRCSGTRELGILWREGERIIVQRRHSVRGNTVITGRLYGQAEGGLSMGRYSLEIVSSYGKEAELDFVVEPPPAALRGR